MSKTNNIILIGNLGADPEVRSTPNGKQKASLRLATNSRYKDNKGDIVTTTQWHNITAWGPAANYAEQYLKKGNHIGVLGRINYRSYSSDDGEEKVFTEVVVDEFRNFDRSGAEGSLPL